MKMKIKYKNILILAKRLLLKKKIFDHELLYKMAIDYYRMHDIYKENELMKKLIKII